MTGLVGVGHCLFEKTLTAEPHRSIVFLTYATLALHSGEVDIHTLARQVGNSASMIERHYSKLTARMAEEPIN